MGGGWLTVERAFWVSCDRDCSSPVGAGGNKDVGSSEADWGGITEGRVWGYGGRLADGGGVSGDETAMIKRGD